MDNTTAYGRTSLLFAEYADLVQYGEQEEEEALFNAIDWAFRDASEETRANLYTGIKTLWDDDKGVGLRFTRTQLIVEKELARG